MKILLFSLNHFPEQTGIGKYQGETAAWFTERGHHVSVVTAPPYYPEWTVSKGYSAWRYRKELVDNAEVYRVPLYIPAKPTGLKRIVHLLSFTLFSAPIMFWLAIKQKPDVILLTAPPLMSTPIALIAGWLAKAKVGVHVQDFEVDAAFQLGLLSKPWIYRYALKIERLALHAFSIISTISPNMRNKLIEKDVPEKQILLIPNWANTDMFDPTKGAGKWERVFKQHPEQILALYSGNLGKKQGLETLIEAAKYLKNENNIHFAICGDGAGREDMVKSAHGLKNITFLPLQQMDDFVHLMIAADIHLLPQKAGAADLVMPSKLGNILASGRPVVAGATEGTQVFEAVKGCGFAVSPEHGKEFAQAIIRLAKDSNLRTTMGDKAKERAAAEWSKEGVLSSMEETLLTVISASP